MDLKDTAVRDRNATADVVESMVDMASSLLYAGSEPLAKELLEAIERALDRNPDAMAPVRTRQICAKITKIWNRLDRSTAQTGV